MKLKIVTLTTDLNHLGLLKLKESLEKFNYDYHIIFQSIPEGTHVFGTQMPLVYNWCKNESGDCTHILYTDAWDTIALGDVSELMAKFDQELLFLGSAEKACFPNPELAKEYPEAISEWKYINGGGWIANIKFFVKMYEDLPAVGTNDQLWLTERFLKYRKQIHIELDDSCSIFQTIGFEGEDDFTYDHENQRLLNRKTGESPIFIHGNGRTNMDKVYSLIK